MQIFVLVTLELIFLILSVVFRSIDQGLLFIIEMKLVEV